MHTLLYMGTRLGFPVHPSGWRPSGRGIQILRSRAAGSAIPLLERRARGSLERGRPICNRKSACMDTSSAVSMHQHPQAGQPE